MISDVFVLFKACTNKKGRMSCRVEARSTQTGKLASFIKSLGECSSPEDFLRIATVQLHHKDNCIKFKLCSSKKAFTSPSWKLNGFKASFKNDTGKIPFNDVLTPKLR